METKVKNRGWVKNVAIIFLSVMLVLTFFSNTIRNRSLPEVATKVISSDTITAKIRGTGTVVANQTYDVVIKQTRKVESVLVKTDQEVNVGDVLFVLSAGDSDELTAAQDTLRQLTLSYQKALVNAADSDYAKENRDIQLAKQALEDAEKERDKLTVSDGDIAMAKDNVAYAKDNVTFAQKKYDKAVEELTEIGSLVKPDDETLNSLKDQIKDKKAEINDAHDALEAAELKYGDQYEDIRVWAEQEISDRNGDVDELVTYYMPYVVKEMMNGNYPDDDKFSDDLSDKEKEALAEEYKDIFDTITACNESIVKLEKEYDTLRTQYDRAMENNNSDVYNKYNDRVKDAKTELDKATEAQTEAEKALTDLQQKQTDYKAALATVKTCQTSLEDLIFSLQEAQKTDNKNQQLEALDLADLARQVSEQQKKVDEFGTDSEGREVKASVSGIVRTINVTAGNSTTADSPMATIEVPDMGYSMSFSATNEQARRVHTGDTATVSNYYWGNTIEATLTSIKTDPKNPQTNKLLAFDLVGDVTVGTSLTLSVGQKSAEYDYVVPNSALRSDSNGDFILVITAKNSPLGNRYIATRTDVTIVASDDTNTAVTGAINNGDYVITTSTAPIKNGDQVRMADQQ